MLETFTFDTFSGRVGETFTVNLDDAAPFATRLIEATVVGSPRLAGGRVPFSLIFQGPVHGPQAIYGVTHDDIGRFDLFLVPLGPDADGMRYEAVFT